MDAETRVAVLEEENRGLRELLEWTQFELELERAKATVSCSRCFDVGIYYEIEGGSRDRFEYCGCARGESFRLRPGDALRALNQVQRG